MLRPRQKLASLLGIIYSTGARGVIWIHTHFCLRKYLSNFFISDTQNSTPTTEGEKNYFGSWFVCMPIFSVGSMTEDHGRGKAAHGMAGRSTDQGRSEVQSPFQAMP